MLTAQGKRPPLLRPSAFKTAGYRALLTDIKTRIRAARIKASLSVNRELICLYWDIGGLIVNRQRTEGWGKSVVEDLASDVQKEFPGIEWFSPFCHGPWQKFLGATTSRFWKN